MQCTLQQNTYTCSNGKTQQPSPPFNHASTTMNNAIENIINYFTKKTNTLFLVDGLGAAMTTFYLFFVLRRFYSYFGMPTFVLSYLALIGFIFCVYSMTCFFLLKRNWTPFLRIISIGNLLYCVLTMVLVLIFLNYLTKLGLLYFTLEVAIILIMVYVETRVASALKDNRQTNICE